MTKLASFRVQNDFHYGHIDLTWVDFGKFTSVADSNYLFLLSLCRLLSQIFICFRGRRDKYFLHPYCVSGAVSCTKYMPFYSPFKTNWWGFIISILQIKLTLYLNDIAFMPKDSFFQVKNDLVNHESTEFINQQQKYTARNLIPEWVVWTDVLNQLKRKLCVNIFKALFQFLRILHTFCALALY